MKERWALGLVSAGFGFLAFTPIISAPPPFGDPMFWVVASAIVFLLSVVNWVYWTTLTRSLFVPSVILLAVARSTAYAFDARLSAIGVWVVVVGYAVAVPCRKRTV